jgi:hypothetical protein
MLPIVQRGLLVAAIISIRMTGNITADLLVELKDLIVAIDVLVAGAGGEYADHVTDTGNDTIAELVIQIQLGKRFACV